MTKAQDVTNNYLIEAKRYSDTYPDFIPSFTVWLNVDGTVHVQINNKINEGDIRALCAAIALYGIEVKPAK